MTEIFLNGNHLFGFQSMLRGCGKMKKKSTKRSRLYCAATAIYNMEYHGITDLWKETRTVERICFFFLLVIQR